MNVRDLLLALNKKSYEKHVKYLLQYNYQYNQKKQWIYPTILILKFVDYKLDSKVQLRNESGCISYINEQLALYN